MDADDVFKSWEGQYQRSWDALQEDEHGSLQAAVLALQQEQRRKRLQRDGRVVRRGIIRHVVLVVDLSRAMDEKDLAPSRLQCTLSLLDTFLAEFFDQNPISQLGIVVTRDAVATRLTELSANPVEQMRILRDNATLGGEPSLQNALELARTSLNHAPKHSSREIVVLMASLTTCDPGNILRTIEVLRDDKIRCSVISLSAELHVCRTLCSMTGGQHTVVLNEDHFREVLLSYVVPRAVTAATAESNLVSMGFPRRRQAPVPTPCACHKRWTTAGFACPRCLSKVCDLPSECPVCSLTLISSPHLARTYHHLFPLESFAEVVPGRNESCVGCMHPFAEAEKGYRCPKCQCTYCLDCDLYIQDSLHNCVGCSRTHVQTKDAAVQN